LYNSINIYEKNSLTLRYKEQVLENEYLESIVEAKKMQMIFTMVLTFFLYILYLGVDFYSLAADERSIAVPFHISMLLLWSYLIPSIYFDFYKKISIVILYLMPIYAILGTLSISYYDSSIYYQEIYLILFWALVAIGYMFLESVLVATVMALSSALSLYLFEVIVMEQYIVHVAFMIAAFTLGVLASYIIEMYSRKNYENKIEILRMQDKLKDLNTKLEEKVEVNVKEQEVLLSLFDTGDTVLFNWNSDEIWSIKSVSRNVINLLGYSKEDFESNRVTYSSCIYEEDLEIVLKEVSEANGSNISFFKHEPYRIINKSGEMRWVLDYTTIVRDSDNKIINYVGILADITEVKLKDKQLLEQSRLAQMGEMISMIAHQWRQPLGAISAVAINLKLKLELSAFDLDKQEEREKFLAYFDHSLNNVDGYVQTLTATIDDFRNFYKPNKLTDELKLEEIVLKSLNIIGASLENDRVELEENYCCTEKVQVYSNEIMQVVLNILKNAQDNFSQKQIENPQIKIETLNRILTISDNGGGVDDDIIDKIFDPYFSTKLDFNGTGLGLYMSKTIIEEHHGGLLKVHNSEYGAVFTIELGQIKQYV